MALKRINKELADLGRYVLLPAATPPDRARRSASGPGGAEGMSGVPQPWS